MRSGTRSFTTYTRIRAHLTSGQAKKREEHTVRKRINLCVLILSAVNATETGESILAVDVHGTRATDTLST